jgi:hypothetical protein
MNGVRICRALAWIVSTALVAALVFRAFFYLRMYKAPDDPYGISDILEYLTAMAILGLVVISALVSVYLLIRGPRRNRVAAGWLLAICGADVLLYFPLHDVAARISRVFA